ncbi:MAG: BamA/TamA family outer membrane protein [Bacteroidota bacterium]
MRRVFVSPRLASACLAVLIAFALSACTHTRPNLDPQPGARLDAPAPTAPPTHRVVLVGNTGVAPETDAVLDRLGVELAALSADEQEETTVVYLGDVMPGGMPDSSSTERAEAEAHLRRQLAPLAGFRGRVVVLAGDRDWTGGLAALRRTETFVEQHLHAILEDEADDPDVDNTFRPDDGYPGPDEVKLADGLRLFALNTGWWLTGEERPFGDTGDYDLVEPVDMLAELEDRLEDRDDDDVIVVGHHPPRSNGRYGGAYPLADHLFPLRNALGPLGYLVPLPVVGSAYPLYHAYIGTDQDLAEARYAALNTALLGVYRSHENVFVAGAHDFSLQHFPLNAGEFNRHVVVSGAAVRGERVAGGGGTALTTAAPGYVVLDFYADCAVWLRAQGAAAEPIARYQVREADIDYVPGEEAEPEPAVLTASADAAEPKPGTTVRVAMNPDYDNLGGFGRLFAGDHWREAWATPVTLPVLDVGTAGRDSTALVSLKRSGSGQTFGLRLAEIGDDERTYALRSVDKEAARRWPEELRGGFAEAAIQDQTSSFHPFAALLVPPLAKAVGIYHTEPRLVYIPDDPRLGRFQAYMANRPALLEERPDEDMSDIATMGFAEEVTSTPDMWEEVLGDVDHVVDQQMFVRARLLDLFLGDHDRHDDQWRWAEFEPFELDSTLTGDARTEGKVYRPIPRDRDYVFMRMDGIGPWLTKQLFARQYQGFGYSYGYVRGSLRNGLGLTRRYTNRLTREDWITAARQMQEALSDSLLETAIRENWPPEIIALHGEEIGRRMRVRRDLLEKVAASVYADMASVVDVVGSHKHERFAVTRQANGDVEVAVFKAKKDGEVVEEVYRRTFHADETGEVRLYGLDGRDRFVLDGDGGSMTIRIIGGPGEDTVENSSTARGLGAGTLVYDSIEGTTVERGRDTGLRLSSDPRVLDYNRSDFTFNSTMPQLAFRANEEDGFFIGGGATFTRHSFRKSPFASRHRISASVAAATGAFFAEYRGHFTDTFGTVDLALDADAATPNNVRTFFGLGNETPNTVSQREFYQARLAEVDVEARLLWMLASRASISLGPRVAYVNVRDDDDRFVGTPQAGIAPSSFENQWFGGLAARADLDARDNLAHPQRGFRWTLDGTWNLGLNDAASSYLQLASALSLYVPVAPRRVVLALRVGGAHNVGSFPFFAANTLGSRETLRGYRRTRFAGRTSFYQNAELRARVLRIQTYLTAIDIGVLGFVDNGRVWTEADDTPVDGIRVSQSFFEGYHLGGGGGLWASFYDQFVLSGTVGTSEEETLVEVGVGFKF